MPFFVRSEREAFRAVRVAMRGEHAFAQSPEEYVLYALGSFDEATGVFEMYAQPRLLCKLEVLKGKEEKSDA